MSGYTRAQQLRGIDLAIAGFNPNSRTDYSPEAVNAIKQAHEDGILDAMKRSSRDDYAWDLGKPFGSEDESAAYERGYCLGRELRHCRLD